jgi:2,4'-dihydroxyacetophenone dioxygenase
MAIPSVTTHQDRLLTVNVNESPGVPIQPEGVSITPLFLDRENGVWVLYASFAPGTTLPTHFHTGTVHFFTTRGKWNYLEYAEDPQTAGSYLYEPGGSTHTFAVPPDATEPAEGFMVVHGANVNFVDGEYHSILDAGAIEELILRAVRKGYVPSMPKYIRPAGGAQCTVEAQVK